MWDRCRLLAISGSRTIHSRALWLRRMSATHTGTAAALGRQYDTVRRFNCRALGDAAVAVVAVVGTACVDMSIPPYHTMCGGMYVRCSGGVVVCPNTTITTKVGPKPRTPRDNTALNVTAAHDKRIEEPCGMLFEEYHLNVE